MGRLKFALLCGALAVACGADGSRAGSLPTPPSGPGAGDTMNGGAGRDAAVPLPPEREERRNFQTPQAGGRYVYIANPRRDTVAVVDSRTLAIQTVEVGDQPTYLQTVPGRDVAVVLNVGSDNASVVRTADGASRVTFLPTIPGATAVAVAPDGLHAVAYVDTETTGATPRAGSFQDLSVLFLEEGRERSVQLSVGFRPLEVTFARDGQAAFVVTEDGISILRFSEVTAPTIIPNVSLADPDSRTLPIDPPSTGVDSGVDAGGDATAGDASADAVGDATDGTTDGARVFTQVDARDVSVTPDGRYGIARVEGTGLLRLLDLQSRTIVALDAGTAVTDLDLSPDGTFALAVLRGRSTVLRVPIPMAFEAPSMVTRTELPGELVGSVTIAPDGRRALAYTTASPVERVTLLDLSGGAPSLVRLRKAVRAVAFAPDSRTALVVHARAAGDPNDPAADLETRIDRSFGYTLVDLATRFAKLQLTPAELGPLGVVPDGTYAFVLLRDDMARVAQAHRVSLRSFTVQTLGLGSPPTSVGAVPLTMRVFIGQEHPEGRITFVDWATGASQSVTGFELNSRIVE